MDSEWLVVLLRLELNVRPKDRARVNGVPFGSRVPRLCLYVVSSFIRRVVYVSNITSSLPNPFIIPVYLSFYIGLIILISSYYKTNVYFVICTLRFAHCENYNFSKLNKLEVS